MLLPDVRSPTMVICDWTLLFRLRFGSPYCPYMGSCEFLSVEPEERVGNFRSMFHVSQVVPPHFPQFPQVVSLESSKYISGSSPAPWFVSWKVCLVNLFSQGQIDFGPDKRKDEGPNGHSGGRPSTNQPFAVQVQGKPDEPRHSLSTLIPIAAPGRDTPVTVGENGGHGWPRRVLKRNTLEPRSHHHCSATVKKLVGAASSQPDLPH
uniref:Uncharacterized protein n=1 Tax=Cannabis sativa TaxID=3483 RepID=A0A803QSV7_CANSA